MFDTLGGTAREDVTTASLTKRLRFLQLIGGFEAPQSTLAEILGYSRLAGQTVGGMPVCMRCFLLLEVATELLGFPESVSEGKDGESGEINAAR